MNGIEFMLRDRAGWTAPGPLPRRRLRWVEPKQEALRPEEQAFVRPAKGRLTTKELSDCYGISPLIISNIWAGRRSAGISPRSAAPQAKRKQK